MRMRSTLITAFAGLLPVVVLVLFAIAPAPVSIPVDPPVLVAIGSPDHPAPVPDLISSLNVELQIEREAIREAIDAFVPRSLGGREDDPIAAASDDTLVWSLDIGAATVGALGGALAFRIPITRGTVTVTGRVGARRDHRGALGWLRGFAGFDIDESVSFDGAVSGTLRPNLTAHWTLDPELKTSIALSQADAVLFGGMLKISLRTLISDRMEARVREQAERLRHRLAEDVRIVGAVRQVWNALHAVVPLSREPSAWLSWQPLSLVAGRAVVTDDRLAMTFGTTVRVAIDATGTEPVLARSPLPAPVVPAPDGAIALRIPVSMRLDALQGLSPATLGLPRWIEHERGTISIESMAVHGVADELTVAVGLSVARERSPELRTTLYLTGTPVLDRTSNRLHLTHARYDPNTRAALPDVADFLLEPAILEQIERRGVFAILESEQELLARARAELALIEASMPGWAEARLLIDSGQLSDVVAEQGWLVAVLEVTGRASVRVTDLAGLLGQRP